MTTRKREASNNSLRNKKERIERSGVHKKGRKWKIKMYLLTNLSTFQIIDLAGYLIFLW